MDARADRILDAAYVLFAQHGFKKVTMSDIAEASEMSRPTLYAAFASKEEVFGGIAARQIVRSEAELVLRLQKARTLEARLGALFDIWIVEPFASVIDSPAALDLLGNAAVYAPKECGELYARFEKHLATLLEEEKSGGKKRLGPKDLAHIMMLATRGLKGTTTSLKELKRLTDGLIAMAIATLR